MDITTQPRDESSVWLLDEGKPIGILHLHSVRDADQRDRVPCERREYIAQGISLKDGDDVLPETVYWSSMSATGSKSFGVNDSRLPTVKS